MVVDAHGVRARVHLRLGELAEAKAAAAEAVAVAEQTDSLSCRAAAQGVLAEALLAAGELSGALAAAEEAERLLAALERPLSGTAVARVVAQIEQRTSAAGAPG